MDERSLLFTYGTLRLPHVQRSLFGRILVGEPATLPGHVVETIAFAAHAAVDLTGASEYPILRRTDDPADRVDGIVYMLTSADLVAADRYETDAYARVEVTLASGVRAFAYVRPEATR